MNERTDGHMWGGCAYRGCQTSALAPLKTRTRSLLILSAIFFWRIDGNKSIIYLTNIIYKLLLNSLLFITKVLKCCFKEKYKNHFISSSRMQNSQSVKFHHHTKSQKIGVGLFHRQTWETSNLMMTTDDSEIDRLQTLSPLFFTLSPSLSLAIILWHFQHYFIAFFTFKCSYTNTFSCSAYLYKHSFFLSIFISFLYYNVSQSGWQVK